MAQGPFGTLWRQECGVGTRLPPTGPWAWGRLDMTYVQVRLGSGGKSLALLELPEPKHKPGETSLIRGTSVIEKEGIDD